MVADVAVRKLTAAECPSGKMPVVIGNGLVELFFTKHVVTRLKQVLLVKDYHLLPVKSESKSAHPAVTAVDDGTIGKRPGDQTILMDEGVKQRKMF